MSAFRSVYHYNAKSMHGLKYIFDLFEIKLTEFFYSCIFDVQYTIVSDTGVSFFTSNLIRVEFKFN